VVALVRGYQYHHIRLNNPALICNAYRIKKMTPYLLSLGAGILVGMVYALFKVRSPAPPGIALLGLLGMVSGEQIVPIVRHWLARQPLTVAWNCTKKS